MSIWNRIVKKFVSSQLSGWLIGTIEEQRIRQERTCKYAKLPAGIQCQSIDIDGLSAEWIRAPGPVIGTM